MKKELVYFQNICENFESEELRNFFKDLINKAPRYFFEIQSKQYDQPGGLLCNAINASQALEEILAFDFIRQQITQPKKRDCIRIATFYIHTDSNIEDVISKIKNLKVQHDIKKGLRDYISELIRCNKQPKNLEQFIIWITTHIGDMGINSDLIREWATPYIDNYFIPECYQYSHCNFTLAVEMDRTYFETLKTKPDTLEPLRTLLRENL